MTALPTIQVYNTLHRQLEPLAPLRPGHVGLYVCGVTVYDFSHIGHARAMVSFDMVVRYLRHRGYRVTYVRNHTDVDDKIIARANQRGVPANELSEYFIRVLDEDLDALGLVRPDRAPRVTRHIADVVGLVEALIERGHAYAVDGGDVFFAVESFPAYGALSGKRLEDLIAGERIAVNEIKRNPADFVLWKASKPGEPAWESPWGPGRPGWHIECSAMAMALLGHSFDIHGGGIDLVFPHHENEIAQSECGTGVHPYARVWMHNGHLTIGDDKMGKSLGNSIQIREVLARVPAEALRLLYLRTHYRSPLPYFPSELVGCQDLLNRVYQARELVESVQGEAPAEPADAVVRTMGEPAADLQARVKSFEQAFHDAMDRDFNSAQALSLLLELVRSVNRFATLKKARQRGVALLQPALAAFDLCGEVLGIGGSRAADFFAEARRKHLVARGVDPAHLEHLMEERREARAAKDWTRADAARDALQAFGVDLMDSASGTEWRPRYAVDEG